MKLEADIKTTDDFRVELSCDDATVSLCLRSSRQPFADFHVMLTPQDMERLSDFVDEYFDAFGVKAK